MHFEAEPVVKGTAGDKHLVDALLVANTLGESRPVEGHQVPVRARFRVNHENYRLGALDARSPFPGRRLANPAPLLQLIEDERAPVAVLRSQLRPLGPKSQRPVGGNL